MAWKRHGSVTAKRNKVARIVSLRSGSGAYGGPADTARNQAVLMAAAGYQVTLIAGVLGSDLPVTAIDDNFRVVLFRVRMLSRRIGFASLISVAAVRSLWREIRSADLAHVSFAREPIPLLAAWFAILQARPLVLQPHGMLTASTGLKQRVFDLVAKPLYRRASAVVALTEVERSALEAWSRSSGDVRILGNPPLAEESRPQTFSAPREALFLARLEKRKRVTVFAEAGALAHERNAGITFAIVGPDQGELSRISPILERAPAVRYEGPLDSSAVPDRLRRTGVFVLTSLNEPWGNVLATAICLEIPVVVTESSALADQVKAFRAGCVVPDDSPSAVADAVIGLLEDPTRYSALSAGCRAMRGAVLGGQAIGRELAAIYLEASSWPKEESDHL